VADVGASIGDMAVQFATPIGAGLYMTQMSGTILGEVGELAATGGESFDYRRGGFDNIFTDDEGNFSASQAAAGIGKVGIDVVQLGMARGLLAKTQAARVAAGEEAVGAGRLGRWLYGGTGQRTQVGGWKHTIDEQTGKVIASRPTLALLAPSEQLSALSASIIGRRAAALRSGGAYSADDFLAASAHLAVGERKWITALVNGMGEGYEEAMQAVLEPYSHEQSISLGEVGNAALYGFAGGVGMGLGMGSRMPSSDMKMYSRARLAYRTMTGGQDLTRTEYDSWTDVQKRGMAAMHGLAKATTDSAYAKVHEDQHSPRLSAWPVSTSWWTRSRPC
jgi:hypothetical protein